MKKFLRFTEFGMNPSSCLIIHYMSPREEDWQQTLGFVTLPPADSKRAYSVKREIDFAEIFKSTAFLKPGVVFEFGLSPPGHRTPEVEWWNWGDLEGDLKGKVLSERCDPMLNDKDREEERKKLPENVVLACKSWEDKEDDQGNEMVWFEVVFDKREIKVEFVD